MDKKLILIFLMAISNFATRALPFFLLSRRKLPSLFVTWLKYIPVPVLAAMVAPDIFLSNHQLDLSADNPRFYVALVSFIVAWATQSLFATVLFGITLLAVIRYYVS